MINKLTLSSLFVVLALLFNSHALSESNKTNDYDSGNQKIESSDKSKDEKKSSDKETDEKAKEELEVPSKEEALTITDTDVVMGDKDAPVTIFEYASMSCGHCSAFFNSTFDPLREKYIDTGKVKFVFRDHPLDEFALRGSMLTKCAYTKGFDNFLRFKRVLFSTQRNWSGKRNYLEVLSNIAKLGGMKSEEFDACMEDKAIEDKILEKRLQTIKSLRVKSTPTFFINGEMVAGAKNIKYLSKIIDSYIEDSETE